MREMTCCFTGHRYIPIAESERIAARLERIILILYEKNIIYYGAGGALGFDYEK